MNKRDSIQDITGTIKKLLPGVTEDDVMDLQVLVSKADDPVVLATLIAALIEERRRTNALLEEIRDALRRVSSSSAPAPPEEELSEADERILQLVHTLGRVRAEDVKEHLGYKGLNAASARLNALVRRGLLRKVRKGKYVYFAPA